MAEVALAHLDALGERATDRDLLSAALEHERSRGDAGDALDARALRHAEAQRLDAGMIVVDGDDLECSPTRTQSREQISQSFGSIPLFDAPP